MKGLLYCYTVSNAALLWGLTAMNCVAATVAVGGK